MLSDVRKRSAHFAANRWILGVFQRRSRKQAALSGKLSRSISSRGHEPPQHVATGVSDTPSAESSFWPIRKDMYHHQQNKCYPKGVRKMQLTAALCNEIWPQ